MPHTLAKGYAPGCIITKLKRRLSANTSQKAANFYPTTSTRYRAMTRRLRRQIARDVKGNLKYSEEDSELLGIASAAVTPDDPDLITSQFTLRTLANFEVEATFRKRGMDALKFQFRHKRGDWHSAGFLLTSSGIMTIPPTTPGVAEQIEMRAIYMKGNKDVGNYSAAIPAFIAP